MCVFSLFVCVFPQDFAQQKKSESEPVEQLGWNEDFPKNLGLQQFPGPKNSSSDRSCDPTNCTLLETYRRLVYVLSRWFSGFLFRWDVLALEARPMKNLWSFQLFNMVDSKKDGVAAYLHLNTVGSYVSFQSPIRMNLFPWFWSPWRIHGNGIYIYICIYTFLPKYMIYHKRTLWVY